MPEGALDVGMWAFCFIYASFELCDSAYDVVCDMCSGAQRSPGHERGR